MGSQTWSVSQRIAENDEWTQLLSPSLQLQPDCVQWTTIGIKHQSTCKSGQWTSPRYGCSEREDNDVRAVSDYYLGSGDKCGPQTITGWSQNVDYARTKDTEETGTRFNSGTGIYTPIIAGYYHVGAYARFRSGGNAVEMCLRKGSTRIACFGNAVQYEWRSTGVCTNQQVTSTADTFSLYLESGGSSDCLQETSWRYARISVQLIQQTATAKL